MSLNRYLHLDGWRGLAILGVIVGHFIPLQSINLGRLGVELFFVLSGRLMAEILFVKNTALGDFFKRRIARVWPALFVYVVAMWLALRNIDGVMHVNGTVALSCLTFTYNYLHTVLGMNRVLDHIWSLCIEEHTYLFLGVIAFLARRYRFDPWRVIAIVAMVCMFNGAFRTFFLGLNYYNVYWRTDTRAASILVAAATYLYIRQRNIAVAGWVPIGFGIVGVLLNLGRVPDPIKYSIGTTFIALALNAIQSHHVLSMRLLGSKPIVWIGLVSFSLYLWQQPFYALFSQRDIYQWLGSPPRATLIVPALLVAIISYFQVEAPARRFLNSRWGRRNASVASLQAEESHR